MIFLNGERFLDEAIRSVVGQVAVDDWELILVDDGSTDASSATARAWVEWDPGRIRYVEHPGHANRGMSASRNLGLEVATGDYVTFLDSDDVWLPSCLAHRLQVARAHPDAEVVIGGTWRWHSWTGDETDRSSDVTMPLPLAPSYVTLEPPRLLEAIYGVPGGGHVPAMCSLLIRRESLTAIGGMVSEFRSLYEDQVLYVKLGLHLRAVIDPRPLALYRQHRDSACSVAVETGVWNPWQANEPGMRFFEWMHDHVRLERGPGSPELEIVDRNIAFIEARAAEKWWTPRPLARRLAPRWVHRLVHRARGRIPAAPPTPLTVLQRWSRQFLDMAVATMDGRVLVLSSPATDPWTADVPDSSFRRAHEVVRRHAADLTAGERFDHIVVPLCSTGVADETLALVENVLLPGGGAALVLAGANHLSSPALSSTPARAITAAQRRFPSHRIALEVFGNRTTRDAVERDALAEEVRGVVIDWHDGRTEILMTMHSLPGAVT